jgi:hypothetical protein
VHLVVCDRNGNWVAVDFQNNHHADYRTVLPRTVAECDRVAVSRLRQMLR